MLAWKTPRMAKEAHGYYAPVNPDFTAPEGELPPLIVNVHGGPTECNDPPAGTVPVLRPAAASLF